MRFRIFISSMQKEFAEAKGKRGRPDLSLIVLEVGGIVVVSYRSNQFRSEKSFFSEGGK